MFSDPQSITINGVAKTLNRTSSSENTTKYATSDRLHRLTISHSYGKARQRHTFRLESDEVTASPLVSGVNVVNSSTFIAAVDFANGYDVAKVKSIFDGALANLSASTGANIVKLIGGEG